MIGCMGQQCERGNEDLYESVRTVGEGRCVQSRPKYMTGYRYYNAPTYLYMHLKVYINLNPGVNENNISSYNQLISNTCTKMQL